MCSIPKLQEFKIWRSSSIGISRVKNSCIIESNIRISSLHINEINSSYVLLEKPQNLDFRNKYRLKAKIRVNNAFNSKDFKVALCFRASYPEFIKRNDDREVIVKVLNSNINTWQEFNLDVNSNIDSYSNTLIYKFSNLDSNNFIPTSSGIGICVYDNNASILPKNISIDVANLSIEKLPMMPVVKTITASQYFKQQSEIMNNIDIQIKNYINEVKLFNLDNIPAFKLAVEKDIARILLSHQKIVKEVSGAGQYSALNRSQYQQESLNIDTLRWMVPTVKNKLNMQGGDLIYYSWDATGRNVLDDRSIVVPSNTVNSKQIVSMYQNQIKPFSFILQNQFKESIEVHDIQINLSKKDGTIFSPQNIDIRVVKNWYIGSNSSIRANMYELTNPMKVPELLLHDDNLVKIDDAQQKNYLRVTYNGSEKYIDISSPDILMPNNAIADDAKILQDFFITPYHSKQIWVDFDSISGDISSGKYFGTVRVYYKIAGQDKKLYIPIQLNVDSHRLSDKMIAGIYYRGQIKDGYSGFRAVEKDINQYTIEMRDLYKHGIRYPTQYIRNETASTIARYIKIRDTIGFPCDKYFFIDGIADASNSTLDFPTNIKLLKKIISENSSCNNPEIYLYGKDEARNDDLVNQIAVWNKVHDAGGKVFVAGFSGTFDHVGNKLDAIVLSGKPEPREIKLFRNAGSYVFMYDNPQSGIPNPSIYKDNFGSQLLNNKYSGTMEYAYQDMFPSIYKIGDLSNGKCTSSNNTYCSIWNNFDSNVYYDHVFAYPLTNSLVGTIQWEGFMEAIDLGRR